MLNLLTQATHTRHPVSDIEIPSQGATAPIIQEVRYVNVGTFDMPVWFDRKRMMWDSTSSNQEVRSEPLGDTRPPLQLRHTCKCQPKECR